MGPQETLLGRSPAIQAIRRKIARLARLDTPLVITGEGGTGKSLVARLIHQAGAGAGGYFEDDIPVLARHFVSRFAASFRVPDVGITEAALSRLCAYPWPGNIRQLGQVVEHAFVLRYQPPTRKRRPVPPDPRPIGVDDLPPDIADR